MGKRSSSTTMPARTLVIGATGNIGTELVAKLRALGEDTVVLTGARSNCDVSIDIDSLESIATLGEQLRASIGEEPIDHVVVICGASTFGAANTFTAESWTNSCMGKLVSVSRLALMLMNNEGGCAGVLRDGGSITVTAGQASRTVNKMWPGIATNNAGLEAFVKNAGNEPSLTRGVRLNAVSPALVFETATKAGLPTAGTVPAADVADAFLPLIHGEMSGVVVDAGGQQVFEKSHHDGMSDKPKSEPVDEQEEQL